MPYMGLVAPRSMMIRTFPVNGSVGPVLPGPMPRPPFVPIDPISGGSVHPIIVGPISTGGPANPPSQVAPNAGTPVPAGFSTNQIFVAPDGSFWQYSPARSQWVNVGTPFNTGAGATPPAPAPSPNGASTAPPVGTTAGAPVSVSVPASNDPYQSVLNWLTNEDSLVGALGIHGIPNWIVVLGSGLLIYRSSSDSRRRNPLRRRRVR